MLFEEEGILHRTFQKNYGQKELLIMTLVRNLRGQRCKSSEDSRNQRARELVSKLRQKPASASETTNDDNKLGSRLQNYSHYAFDIQARKNATCVEMLSI